MLLTEWFAMHILRRWLYHWYGALVLLLAGYIGISIYRSALIASNTTPAFNTADDDGYSSNSTVSQWSLPLRGSSTANLTNLHKWLYQYCPHRAQDLAPFYQTRTSTHFDDVILIVGFNYATFYDVIPLLELLYRPTFRTIVYCGRGWTPPKYDVPFVSISDHFEGAHNGSFLFECINKLADLDLRGVKGYLMIGDDTLLYPWRLLHFKKETVWIRQYRSYNVKTRCWSTLGENGTDCSDTSKEWTQWRYFYSETVAAYRALRTSREPTLRACYKSLVRQNGKDVVNFRGTIADAYYIPARIGHTFATVSRHFESFKVYLEIVVPTAVQCLEGYDQVQLMEATNLWLKTQRRSVAKQPWKLFKESLQNGDHYLHPAKLYPVVKGEAVVVRYFCDKILPVYLTHLIT